MTKNETQLHQKYEFISNELPDRWQLGKLKHALNRVISGGTPDSSNSEYWTEGGLGTPWVNIGDMSKYEKVTETQKEVTELGLASKKLEVLKPGTIIYSIYATLGAVSELEIDAAINQALLGLYPKDESEKRFMIYWLKFLRPHLNYFASSSTQFNLNANKVVNFPYPNFDAVEKENISNFLDKEVSRINHLVEEKQNLINLLKEKRQALISHVVTKGLNPDVEMKDSGVEWIGEIPTEWTVSKVKHLCSFQVGWTPPTGIDANFIGDNLWANISDLKGKYIEHTAKQISDTAAYAASMSISPKGSLLYSFKLSVGAVSFAAKDMYTNEAIASFLETSKLPLSYLYYALPKFVIENASTNIYGARILNQKLINNAFLLEPSFEEAEKIAAFLDHQTAKIDNLVKETEQSIQLLKERRAALISAAVTGKIDVRDWEVNA